MNGGEGARADDPMDGRIYCERCGWFTLPPHPLNCPQCEALASARERGEGE